MSPLPACKNKNYDIALEWVKKTYPFFFGDNILSIELVSFDSQPHAYGTHRYVHELEKSAICISNGRFEVWDFIDTIVHELVHSTQYLLSENLETKEKCEAQADGLGWEAAKRYKEEHGIPIWK